MGDCAQGHPVRNKHDNCPYSLLCATCDMDADYRAAAEAVRSLHQKVYRTTFDEVYEQNAMCAEDRKSWPCDTILIFGGEP